MTQLDAFTVDAFGCDLVTHRLDKDGYAFHGKSRAHIVAWIEVNGPLPMHEGKPMQVDHMCRRKNCRAVHHLEPVTPRENQLRKVWSYRCKRKLCPKGHSMADAVVTLPEMGRVCRRCNSEARAC